MIFPFQENNLYPIKVENTQSDEIIKASIYAASIPFMFENTKISFVKAEKVVKDPKKPMIINGDINSLLFVFIAKKIPIKKQPNKFTITVPIGNPKITVLSKMKLTKYLDIAPTDAPIPIRR